MAAETKFGLDNSNILSAIWRGDKLKILRRGHKLINIEGGSREGESSRRY